MSIRTVVESIMGSDDESDAESPESDAEADDEFGGLGDDGGDLEGLEDGDGFGGMDDSGDEFGGGGAQVDELEHRIDEIETEIDDLSSTVETVRTENEQISASVGDVEENVRKLLDIYEMVTNGVNPFADDVEAGAGGGMGGDFGLFDDDGGGDGGSDESVDQDVAEADPEGFFDEDLDEDDLAVDDEPAVDDVFGDEPTTEPTDDATAADPESPEGGTSFEDLKAEYDDETGGSASEGRPEPDARAAGSETATEGAEAEAATDGTETATATEGAGTDVAPAADAEPRGDASRSDENGPADNGERAATSATAAGANTGSSRHASSAESEGDDYRRQNGAEPAAEPGTTPSPEPQGAGAQTRPEPTGGQTRTNGGAARDQGNPAPVGGPEGSPTHAGKPYLTAVPGGYTTDLVVTEWLEFLVSNGGVREAASALEYYETIGWLAPAVRERLEDRLGGFEGGGDGTLDTEDHERSLEYVSQLNGGGATAPAPTAVPDGGGSDGVQR